MPCSPLYSHILPATFIVKKQNILSALATPLSSYTDRSPKGSVDDGIKDLIDRINRLEGIVTTSSCSGRISVFLQGRNKFLQGGEEDEEGERVQKEVDNIRGDNEDVGGELPQQFTKVVPGGKGRGGRWLFVSHEPVKVPVNQDVKGMPLFTLFGLSNAPLASPGLDPSKVRFVRFQFEPMILHIMAASLYHAQEILSAAINAGFRESGVQSLKNLDDPNSFPMVAVRTSGLALSSLIGYMHDTQDEEIQGMVSEEYLEILMSVANERFGQNAERIKRFSDNLFEREKLNKVTSAWEDKRVRQERKRTEGLKQQQRLREEKKKQKDLYYKDDYKEWNEDE